MTKATACLLKYQHPSAFTAHDQIMRYYCMKQHVMISKHELRCPNKLMTKFMN